jgi:hypothetical protein
MCFPLPDFWEETETLVLWIYRSSSLLFIIYYSPGRRFIHKFYGEELSICSIIKVSLRGIPARTNETE